MKIQRVEKELIKTNKKQQIGVKTYSVLQSQQLDTISFTASSRREKQQKINLSSKELRQRTSSEQFIIKKMLGTKAPEYTALAQGDKKALAHLTKAAVILDDVYLKQDHHDNIEFRTFLQEEIKNGNQNAEKAMKLFEGQRGIIAKDLDQKTVILKKGAKQDLGRGLYPKDLSIKEFHQIIEKMIEENKIEEIKNILNQRSVVKRSGNELIAIDYTKEYEKEFTKAAKELESAAELSTNKEFKEFLFLQAKALRKNDPMLDAYADKKWAELQDTPLEFTITRENYEDKLTDSVFKNEELIKKIQSKGINPVKKDLLGVRVGIVNKKGTENLLKIKKYLPLMSQNMPFSNEYQTKLPGESKQTMIDADIVLNTGQVGIFRNGICMAENLPNSDKLSFTIDGGRRNVYHRQIRTFLSDEAFEKKAKTILDPSLHKYFSVDYWQEFVIGHENAHSLGPQKQGLDVLGAYKGVIEECKADMAAISSLDMLVKEGMYTELEKKQIITSFTTHIFRKAPPNKKEVEQAHRVREVMQIKFLSEYGGLKVSKDGIINIDFDKMVSGARKMLEQVIRIQIDKKHEDGEKFVKENFKWSNASKRVAKKLKIIDKYKNGRTINMLAEQLLRAV